MNGLLIFKSLEEIILEVSGIGYSLSVPFSTYSKLPESGNVAKIYIVESTAGMYGGITNLYGFLTKEERKMFLLIKNEVPSTGAKKALEYTDKISKSFADFKSAVLSKDTGTIMGAFGFTKKTADKLVNALKEKIGSISITGEEKWSIADLSDEKGVTAEAVSALTAIGYDAFQAKIVVNKIYKIDNKVSLEDLIKKSLQNL
jgi:Holliday junction DNA helicase RuvA